jgi:hypothetical protein
MGAECAKLARGEAWWAILTWRQIYAAPLRGKLAATPDLQKSSAPAGVFNRKRRLKPAPKQKRRRKAKRKPKTK